MDIRRKIAELNSRLTDAEEINATRQLLTPGVRGRDGAQGSQGYRGAQGTQGISSTVVGFVGNQGFQGLQGNQGSQGSDGFQGDIGYQGTQGNQGVQGTQGSVGNQGFIGIQGDIADIGFRGTQGPDGSQGPVGAQGSIGNQGFIGVPISAPGSVIAIVPAKTDGAYIEAWPLNANGVPSRVIFITLAAGGGGSGATLANGLGDLAIGPGGAGGGGGFIRRLPIYYDSNIIALTINVGAGGAGGTTGAGSNGADSDFNIIYGASSGRGTSLLRCRGGGGGSVSGPVSTYPIVTGGYGGGVVLEPSPIAGNSQVEICADALGQRVDSSGTIRPVESANINGYYESGSGGLVASVSTTLVPGAPGVTNAKIGTKLPSQPGVVAAGGSSGMIGFGSGANTIVYNLGGTTAILTGLNGSSGVFILEYLF